MKDRVFRRALGAGLVLLAIPLALSLVDLARGSEPTPFLAAPRAGTSCLLPGPAMRVQHMTYLKERRDRALRTGARVAGAPIGAPTLRACVGCHGDRAGFCNRCHDRASVSLDCYGCHQD